MCSELFFYFMRSLSMALQQEQQQPGHMTQEAEPSPAVPSQRIPPAGLSAREVEVLSLVACGLTNPQIAERLLLSEKTVANHLTRMFKKIGCPNRAAAVAFAMRHGIT
jgi:DNA-binding NarL/FixJ family response regulator